MTGNRRKIEECIQEHEGIVVEVVNLQDISEVQLVEICKNNCHMQTCPHFSEDNKNYE